MTIAVPPSDDPAQGGVVGVSGPAPRVAAWRLAAGSVVAVVLVAVAGLLVATPGQGVPAATSLAIGAALGVVFARGRFCFFCILRDLIEHRDSAPSYAILAALAVGGIGYAVVFGMFLPDPSTGRLPAQAFIGPVSWVLVAGGVVFGVGMALSGGCISALLYRMGEGYGRAPIGLLGALMGFGLGFLSWQPLYLGTIVRAPEIWLPAELGYAGALAVHLVILGILALALMRWLPPTRTGEGGRPTLGTVYRRVFVWRWPALVTGALVGIIGAVAYLRVAPLGVTQQLGTLSRAAMTDAGLIGDRLDGLDGFAGCVAVVGELLVDNGWLIGAMVLGSFAVSVAGGRFRVTGVTLRNGTTALLGGVLMGWGAMVALGCTIGTLLSGISAFAVAGWVFGAAVVAGVWLGIRLRLHSL